MCFGGSTPEPAPPPAAPGAADPVLTNMYDPAGTAAEKGAASNKAAGTSQLKVNLDPTVSNIDKGTGLQITK
tara:strand:- start:825 stop:1040 length:216 start_codon:yes stop_codon:yes gene_type:complete